jgi:hypothetical protein
MINRCDIASQRLPTINALLEAVFSMRSVPRLYVKSLFGPAAIQTGFEHGSRGIAIIGATTTKLLSKTEDFKCASEQ